MHKTYSNSSITYTYLDYYSLWVWVDLWYDLNLRYIWKELGQIVYATYICICYMLLYLHMDFCLSEALSVQNYEPMYIQYRSTLWRLIKSANVRKKFKWYCFSFIRFEQFVFECFRFIRLPSYYLRKNKTHCFVFPMCFPVVQLCTSKDLTAYRGPILRTFIVKCFLVLNFPLVSGDGGKIRVWL